MIKGEGNGHCRQKTVFINRHKVKAGQYKSEATTFSKLLELNCHTEWQEKRQEGITLQELSLNSLGSAEILTRTRRRVAGSYLSFGKATLVMFALGNDKTKGKKTGQTIVT